MTDSRELFRALEFAHYAERFRGQVFIIALPAEIPFTDFLLDLKVLAGYRIGAVLVTLDPGGTLESFVTRANKRGARFDLSIVTDLIFQQQNGQLELDFGKIENSIGQGKLPVIAYLPSGEEPRAPAGIDPAYVLAGAVADRMGARKLFLAHPLTGAFKRVLPGGAVLAGEIDGLPEKLRSQGLAEGVPLCAFIAERLAAGIPDVVLIEGKNGELFREVFTHDGAGVLFNATANSSIRPAELKDVTEITFLLRPHIEGGRILPSSESRIEENIANYWIYEIDAMPVGLACLKPFGDEVEMAQISTLARYRGKGQGKELARFLIARARELGCKGVFALSIDERMWEFFLSLGFERVARETLPEQWRRDYDLTRESRAFRMAL